MTTAEIIEAYGAAWNSDDETERRNLLDASWADDGVYCDPTTPEVEGREALHAHIGGVRATFGAITIVQTTGVDEHNGWARFGWRMDDADGSPMIEGFDAVELADDGRVRRIVGFFGPFPDL
jgi:hypothetical protein